MSDEGAVSALRVAERSVLGAVLARPEVLREVMTECAPGDFEDLRIGEVLAGISRMIAAGEPVDVLTVGDRLVGWGVRGIDLVTLDDWRASTPSPNAAGYYARIVRNAAMRRELASVGSLLAAGSRIDAENPAIVIANAVDRLTGLRDRSVTGEPIRSLRGVLDAPESADEYEWIVPGLLERGDRFVLTGIEGGGKSTLLRQIAICAAAGLHPFDGARVRPVRVLVVDAENSERQWRRAVRRVVSLAGEMGERDPRDALSLACVTRMDLTRATDLGRVHRYVDEARPDLVMIGPLYRLIPRAINSDDDAAPLLAALDSIRDRGVTMLLEAHAGHALSATGDRDLRPRGSAALLGWPEFGFGLRKSKEATSGGRAVFELVRWRGDRDARDWPRHVSRGPSQLWPWERTAVI